MKEYNVISCRTIRELCKLVNESIKLGWKVMGGISQGDHWFMQAMMIEKNQHGDVL